jgi:hypothetical protein
MSEFAVFPQQAVGFRAWNVGEDGLLLGLGYGSAWRLGVNIAVCGKHRPHLAPDVGCECGLYALNKPPKPFENQAVGVVAAHGSLMVHYRSGFRAEQMIIMALAITPTVNRHLLARIAQRYQVPLVAFEQLEAIASGVGIVPQAQSMDTEFARQDAERVRQLSRDAECKRQGHLLALPPTGPMMGHWGPVETRRYRALFLGDVIASGDAGILRSEFVRKHWPTAVRDNAEEWPDVGGWAARNVSDTISAVIQYLHPNGFIRGEMEGVGPAKRWFATDAGRAVNFEGQYATPPEREQIVQERIQRFGAALDVAGRPVVPAFDQAIAPPSGPLLDTPGYPQLQRYRTIFLQAAIDAGEAGVSRHEVLSQFWPHLKGWHQLVPLRRRMAPVVQSLKEWGYIKPNGELGANSRWHATEAGRSLQLIGTYAGGEDDSHV